LLATTRSNPPDAKFHADVLEGVYPEKTLVQSNRHLIRHAADVPVLLSAMSSKPDWLLTHNTKHFTQAVANRTGLRIATPVEFFRTLSSLLGKSKREI
jgi:hypothetical protein